jgi:uncharacterized protein YjbI with pentapeptide repeats
VGNRLHFEKLTENIKLWNEWRAANPDVVPDLSDAMFSLSQKQFGLINGGPVDLSAALLMRADLKNATLVEANLDGADLSEANLAGASLNFAGLRGANLTDAILTDTDLSGVVFDGAIIHGADFAGARNLTAEQLENAIGDAATLLPEGIAAPESWGTCAGEPEYDDAGPAEESEPGQIFIAADEEVDLYAVLGVSRGETAASIRAIYRTKAKAAHPDLNPGEPTGGREFRRLTQAYAILRDPKRRKRYDRGEIGPDGEETPAYIEACRRAVLARQLWRYAMIGIAATVLVGLGLAVSVAHLLKQNPKLHPALPIEMQAPVVAAERREPANKPQAEAKVAVAPDAPKDGAAAQASVPDAQPSAPAGPELAPVNASATVTPVDAPAESGQQP